MGLDEPALRDDDLEIVRQALDTDHPYFQGITLERLLEEGYVRLGVAEPFAPLASPTALRTQSGKIQIEAPTLVELGLDPLPTFTPPVELEAARGEEGESYPLMLLSPPEHQFLNSTFVNIPSLRQGAGETKLLLHPSEAAERGIHSGDAVRIWNDRGDFFARAVVTDDVRPGVAVSYGVRWPRLSEQGRTVNDTTSQGVTDMGGGAVFYDNAVEVEPVRARSEITPANAAEAVLIG
jgi:anaerobic selenocysteine-containing dehydrogenase